MKFATARTLTRAGAYLRQRAKALAEKLLRKSARHISATEIIDGFILRASRVGDRATAIVLDAPAVITFGGITGPDNATAALYPSITYGLGRDMATIPLGTDSEPKTSLETLSRFGGYYFPFDGAFTDPGINAPRTIHWMSPLYPTGRGHEWLTLQYQFMVSVSEPTGNTLVSEVRLLVPPLRSYPLIPVDGHPEYYSPDTSGDLPELPQAVHTLRYWAQHMTAYFPGFSLTTNGSSSYSDRSAFPDLCVLPCGLNDINYATTQHVFKYLESLAGDGPYWSYGVQCAVVERAQLIFGEDGALDSAATGSETIIDPTTFSNTFSQPEAYVGFPALYKENRLQARTVGLVSESGTITLATLVNSYCHQFISSPDRPDDRFYTLLVRLKTLGGGAATHYLFTPTIDDGYGFEEGFGFLEAAQMGEVVYGFESSGELAVAVTGYLTGGFVGTVGSRSFGIVEVTAAGATIDILDLFALPFVGSPVSDSVVFIGNSKFIFPVTTQTERINIGTAQEDEIFNYALAQYDASTGGLTILSEVQAGMGYKNGGEDIDLTSANAIAPGRVFVVQQELADGEGNITQPAVLLASIGAHSGRMRNNGVTKISYDSGLTWHTLADIGARFGAVVAGGVTWPPKAGHILEA